MNQDLSIIYIHVHTNLIKLNEIMSTKYQVIYFSTGTILKILSKEQEIFGVF